MALGQHSHREGRPRREPPTPGGDACEQVGGDDQVLMPPQAVLQLFERLDQFSRGLVTIYVRKELQGVAQPLALLAKLVVVLGRRFLREVLACLTPLSVASGDQ